MHREAEDDRPGGPPHQDRIGITEGDEAERQPDKTAERQAKQQPRRDSRNFRTTTMDSTVEMMMMS